MAGKIKIFNKNFKALGSTSKAFSIVKTEELMREFTLSFSISNNDSIFSLINEESVFEYDGQKFDVVGIDSNTGNNNLSQIIAEHISYRLADYTLPNGYSFCGTVREVANDILQEAKTVNGTSANEQFTISRCVDVGIVSLAFGNSTNITARDALISLSEVGVEVEFDNLTINIPKQRGIDRGTTFEFGKNLANIRKVWQKGNGWSYEIEIADLQKAPGHAGDVFTIGDTVTIYNSINGTTKKERVISYTECDDPSQNKITVGTFIRDDASLSIETDKVANNALTTANNSIQQEVRYNNISLSHADGFKAVNRDGTIGVKMNGDNCFAVYSISGDEWNLMSELDINGLQAGCVTMPGYPNFKIIVGKGPRSTDALGLFIVDTDLQADAFFKIWVDGDTNDVILQNNIANKKMMFCDHLNRTLGSVDSDGLHSYSGNNTADHHVPSDGIHVGYTMHFVDGIYTGWTSDS